MFPAPEPTPQPQTHQHSLFLNFIMYTAFSRRSPGFSLPSFCALPPRGPWCHSTWSRQGNCKAKERKFMINSQNTRQQKQIHLVQDLLWKKTWTAMFGRRKGCMPTLQLYIDSFVLVQLGRIASALFLVLPAVMPSGKAPKLAVQHPNPKEKETTMSLQEQNNLGKHNTCSHLSQEKACCRIIASNNKWWCDDVTVVCEKSLTESQMTWWS